MRKACKKATAAVGIVRLAAGIRVLFSRYWLAIRLIIRHAMKLEAGS
jgi:hypothetical protein